MSEERPKYKKPKITKKQVAIMKVILLGNEEADPVDIDQLLERLDYKTTKQSIQFSIRALVSRNFIYKGELQKRRGKKRVIYLPTREGYYTFAKYVGIYV